MQWGAQGGYGVSRGVMGCPWWGQDIHGRDLLPCTHPHPVSLADGPEPTWGQWPWGPSRWLRGSRSEGRRAALALRGAAGAAQGGVGGRRGAAVGCLGQWHRALRGHTGVRDPRDPWGPSGHCRERQRLREGMGTLGDPQDSVGRDRGQGQGRDRDPWGPLETFGVLQSKAEGRDREGMGTLGDTWGSAGQARNQGQGVDRDPQGPSG